MLVTCKIRKNYQNFFLPLFTGSEKESAPTEKTNGHSPYKLSRSSEEENGRERDAGDDCDGRSPREKSDHEALECGGDDSSSDECVCARASAEGQQRDWCICCVEQKR